MKRVQRYEPSVDSDGDAEMIEHSDGEWVRFDDVPSWEMLMDILDAVYPADVFTGESGKLGPGIIKKLREIDEIRRGSTGDSNG